MLSYQNCFGLSVGLRHRHDELSVQLGQLQRAHTVLRSREDETIARQTASSRCTWYTEGNLVRSKLIAREFPVRCTFSVSLSSMGATVSLEPVYMFSRVGVFGVAMLTTAVEKSAREKHQVLPSSPGLSDP